MYIVKFLRAQIFLAPEGYYWTDPAWGQESDEFFATLDECRANIREMLV